MSKHSLLALGSRALFSVRRRVVSTLCLGDLAGWGEVDLFLDELMIEQRLVPDLVGSSQ